MLLLLQTRIGNGKVKDIEKVDKVFMPAEQIFEIPEKIVKSLDKIFQNKIQNWKAFKG